MKEAIREEIRAFVAAAQTGEAPDPLWLEPLVGFVSADDSRLAELAAAVSASHALPRDLLPTAGAVIVVFVPFHRSVDRENRRGKLASRRWAEAYVATNAMLARLGEHLSAWLATRGHALVPIPATHNFDPERLVADWSHRHYAVLAGLGKLGHHNLLITERGCVGRLCSYVTDVQATTDPGPGHEPCLHLAGLPCLRCVTRCVGDALAEASFDRHACYAQCLQNDGQWPDLGTTDVCGKCIAGVPCSHIDPSPAKNRRPSSG